MRFSGTGPLGTRCPLDSFMIRDPKRFDSLGERAIRLEDRPPMGRWYDRGDRPLQSAWWAARTWDRLDKRAVLIVGRLSCDTWLS